MGSVVPGMSILSGLRALVADDQAKVRGFVRRALMGMECFETIDDALDGKIAWEKLENSLEFGGYDLVICETDLPELDGIELLKKARRHPELSFTRFIMISSMAQEPTVASSLGEWMANDFLVKPFSPELLERRVRSVLEGIQSPDEVLYRKVEKLKRAGMVEEAISVMNEWELSKQVAMARWFNVKGECLLESGRIADAIPQFEMAMSISKIFLAAYKNYAEASMKIGEVDKAVHALEHVDKIGLPDAKRSLSLGEMMVQVGRQEEAKRCFDRAIRHSEGDERGEIRRKVADLCLDKGLFVEAEEIFRELIADNLDDVELHNRYTIALRQQGKFEEAERRYHEALKRHPRHAGISYNLGVLYVAKGESEKAMRCFRKALVLDPGFTEARQMIESIDGG